MEEIIEHYKKINGFLAEFIDFANSVISRGENIRFSSIPNVEVYLKDSDDQQSIIRNASCCQFFGNIKSYVINNKNNFYYIRRQVYDKGYCSKLFTATETVLDWHKYIKQYEIDNNEKIFSEYVFSYYLNNKSIKSIINIEEFIKILDFWQSLFYEDFPFEYNIEEDKGSISKFSIIIKESDLEFSKKIGLATLEIARMVISDACLIPMFFYYIKNKYGSSIENKYVALWIVSKFFDSFFAESSCLNISNGDIPFIYGAEMPLTDINKIKQKLTNGDYNVSDSFYIENNYGLSILISNANSICINDKNLTTIAMDINKAIKLSNEQDMECFFVNKDKAFTTGKHIFSILLEKLIINDWELIFNFINKWKK